MINIKKVILIILLTVFSFIISGCSNEIVENKDIKIVNIISRPDSISFKIAKLDQNVTIETVTLFEQGKIKYYLYNDFDYNSVTFENLSRDTKYSIKIEYNNNGLESFTISLKTVETKKPTIRIDVFNVTSQGFEFRAIIIDNTTVGKIKFIEIFVDELIIDSFEANIDDFDIEFNDTLNEYTIIGEYTGLKTDEKYILKITYEYDLFDGRGIKSINKSMSFNTL